MKGGSDPSHFIFEINIGKKRIRHTTTVKFKAGLTDGIEMTIYGS